MYWISWQDSESTKSLKLKILDRYEHSPSCLDITDIYEDGIHTVAVKHRGERGEGIFFMFRLKFEKGLLSLPMIQFINYGDWYRPVTNGNCSILLERIDIRGRDIRAQFEFVPARYKIIIPIFSTDNAKVSFEEIFYCGYSREGNMTNPYIKMTIGVWGDVISCDAGKVLPNMLFGHKTTLKLKLAGWR